MKQLVRIFNDREDEVTTFQYFHQAIHRNSSPHSSDLASTNQVQSALNIQLRPTGYEKARDQMYFRGLTYQQRQ